MSGTPRWVKGKGDYLVGDAGTDVGFSSRGDGSVGVVIRAEGVDLRFELTPEAVVGLRDYLEAAAKQRASQ
jgi:hypothetical protein